MKKIILLLAMMVSFACANINAQNADSLYFYKNGNIMLKIAIADVDSFTFVPKAPEFQGYGIDLSATGEYGGMVQDSEYDKYGIYLYDKGIKCYSVKEGLWRNFLWKDVKSNWKELSKGKSFRITFDNQHKVPAIIYLESVLSDDETYWIIVPIVGNAEHWGVVGNWKPNIDYKMEMEGYSLKMTDGVSTIISGSW